MRDTAHSWSTSVARTSHRTLVEVAVEGEEDAMD
jgi:hypothetical protein